MMTKAEQLLKIQPESVAKKSTPSVVLDGRKVVDVPTYGRKAEVRAVSRLFRIVQKRSKAIAAELDVLKGVIRGEGQELLDVNAEAGNYYGKAVVGGVNVTRANKFKPTHYTQEQLIGALGENEYRLMFNTKASLDFPDADTLAEHVQMCELAGITIQGEERVVIVGNSKLAEFACKTVRSLEPGQAKLVKRCSQDQAARVGGR